MTPLLRRAEQRRLHLPHHRGFLIGVPFGAAWSKNLAKNLLITVGLFLIYLAIVILLIPLLLQT
jgi:hypothetical protein